MNKPRTVTEAHDPASLIASIRASSGTDSVVNTTLKTSQRVIARVTDGIYRQPGSAIRELISNAYDADAKKVVISTDAPRFDRITVEDDGHGMTPEALAYLLQNIGGSAKRREQGAALGMTSPNNHDQSPDGRELIGKIGIGLFSVSQLTNSFHIITKTKGDKFRTIAAVAMRQYADEHIQANSSDPDEQFESGKVSIWREVAADVDVHGTTIVLNSIRRQAKETLRSQDVWSIIEQNEHLPSDERIDIDPPKYHIGRVDPDEAMLRQMGNGEGNSLPWNAKDSPSDAFEKLVKCVWTEAIEGNPRPKLDQIFDYYLNMVWQLALAIPLPYVDKHLFDENPEGWARTFQISNSPKGNAQELNCGNASIRQCFSLSTRPPANFKVIFDQLELKTPVLYRNLPTTDNAIKQQLIFVGKVREEFKNIPIELSGGPLEFEAYLFWTPKIAPVEHQGSLIRVNGASGTLFDPTFMRYQVQEIQRLKQITSEIFVYQGLDSALNIDRESFNVAHPHAVYITKWLHSALRQLTNAQKRLGSELRADAKDLRHTQTLSAIQEVAEEVWQRNTPDPGSRPPKIVFEDDVSSSDGDTYIFGRETLATTKKRTSKAETFHAKVAEEKLKAITQVLASFDLLDNLPKKKQQALLKAIFEILEWSGE